MTALIPISPNVDRFASDSALKALSLIPDKYKHFVFIIADQLQIYNRAAAQCSSLPAVLNVILDESEMLPQRTRWVKNLMEKINQSRVERLTYEVLGISNLVDEVTASIFRRVLILFHTVPRFRADINKAARDHVNRVSKNTGPAEMRIGLSESYILEEIAISVRLHITRNIPAEFYIGNHLPVVLNIYRGEYGFDGYNLSGGIRSDNPTGFFEWDITGDSCRWQDVTTPNIHRPI